MSIQQHLIRWGRSRAVNDPYAIDYPHETPFSRMSKSDGWAVSMPALDEDEHASVDRVVSELRLTSASRHNIIVFAYVDGLPDNSIARIFTKLGRQRVSRHEIRDMRLQAEGWIESRIEVDRAHGIG